MTFPVSTSRNPPSLTQSALNSPRQQCSSLWQRLRTLSYLCQTEPLVSDSELGSNVLGVLCPQRTAVKVRTVSGTSSGVSSIHANIVRFLRRGFGRSTNTAPESTTVIIGQSPQHFAQCEKFLVQGLDSGQGLFEFVSRKAQVHPDRSTQKTIIGQLRAQWNDGLPTDGPLVLAGRYEVKNLTCLSTDETHSRYALLVEDVQDRTKTKTVILTQAGLKFTDRLLRSDQISQADALMNAHIALTGQNLPCPATGQTEPMCISYAGFGRNATLSVYRQVLKYFSHTPNDNELDTALEGFIKDGRNCSDPRFVHSDAQVDELKKALRQAFNLRNADARRSLPASPTGRHVVLPEATAAPSLTSSPGALAVNSGTPTDTPTGRKHDTAAIRAVVDANIDASPLQFLEALSRVNRDAAAFCAVQYKRMSTPRDATGEAGCFIHSMHPEVKLYRYPSTSEIPQAHPLDPSLSDTRNDGVPFAYILKQDLDRVMEQQHAGSLLPRRLADALEASRIGKSGRTRSIPEKLSVVGLTAFAATADPFSIDALEDLAINNPAATTLFNFLDHSLLIKDSVKTEPTERYPYIDDKNFLAEKVCVNGTPFLPTFLEGVERDFNATDPLSKGWRVQIGGQWQAGQTRQEVLQHVFLQALQHLQTDRLADRAMPVYPLVAYELLADAIGVAVPEYLKQREQAIHATLAGNRQRIEERTAQRALDKQQLLAERAAGEVRQQQDLRENGVTNVFQMRFCYAGYQRELRNASVDTLFMLPSDSRYGAIVAELDERLTHTHDQQAISSRNHTGRGTDNRCWLRSSWLSVFAALRPDELAERLRAMSTPIAAQHYAYKDAPVLQAIAQYYRDDPVAFMQGGAPGNRRSAHLGPNDAVSALLPAQDGMTLPEDSIEEFLHGLQLDVAAAFRAGDPSYMSEIESLWRSNGPASSNLPVTLHRAFGLPILVVETGVSRSEGEQEQQTNRSVQLRVAAPLGSDLARHIEQLPHNPDQYPDVTNALLAAFKDLPVLRLNQDHYDLYMPKASSSQAGAHNHVGIKAAR